MERWPLAAAVMSAVRPRLLGRSTLAPRFSSSLAIARWPLAAAVCSRAMAVCRPSVRAGRRALTGPPLRSHVITLCSSPLSAE
eukprot:scaffold87503_cov75-Phaeocystis_antarctica.AAC.2